MSATFEPVPVDATAQIRQIIEATILQTAIEQNKNLPPLVDDLALMGSGLDSLCLAVIVARLEDQLGVDPFSIEDDFAFPVTIGDLVAAYERAVGPQRKLTRVA